LLGFEQRPQCSGSIALLCIDSSDAVRPSVSHQLLVLIEFMFGVRLPTEGVRANYCMGRPSGLTAYPSVLAATSGATDH